MRGLAPSGCMTAPNGKHFKSTTVKNAFSEAYHFNGHDSDGAKAAAREKAVEIDALDVFNKFYHVA